MKRWQRVMLSLTITVVFCALINRDMPGIEGNDSPSDGYIGALFLIVLPIVLFFVKIASDEMKAVRRRK